MSDPTFIENVCDVAGLYLAPPERALVLCVDEKSQIQTVQDTAPAYPLQPDQFGRITHDYCPHGARNLFVALDVTAGTVINHFKRDYFNADCQQYQQR